MALKRSARIGCAARWIQISQTKGSGFFNLTLGQSRVRERAVDGLEAFRVNRLCSETDSDISDERVRFFQPAPGTKPYARACHGWP